MDRNELLLTLSRMVKGQFDIVVGLAGVPVEYLSGVSSPQATRAGEVVRYYEGRPGGLASLIEVVAQVQGKVTSTALSNHNLPFAPNPDFVGRETELADLHRLLAPGTPVALTQQTRSITGLGGVGKTQLALQYAHLHLGEYAQVLWVDASGEDIAAAMTELAPKLGLELPDDLPPVAKAERVREKLQDDECRLLVLDNVDGSKSYPSYLPRSGQTRVLITTRRTDLRGVKAMRLDVLPMKQAIELLIGEHDFDEVELQAAEALCVELGRLTLAVAVASRMLRPGLLGPSSLLTKLKEKGPVEMMEGGPEDALFRKHPSLVRLFDESVAQLDLSQPSQALALAMVEVGGWFAGAPIPVDVLAEAAGQRLDDGEVGEPMEGMSHLLDLGLATVFDGMVLLHRLVGAYGAGRSGGSGQKAVHATLQVRCSSTAPETMSLRALKSLAPHLEHASAALAADGPQEHFLIPLRLAQHYKHMADYARALRVCRVAIAVPPEERWEGHLLNEAGQALVSQGQYEAALEYHQRALTIMERIFGEDHPDTAMTLNALGQALSHLGLNEEALEYYERDFAIMVQVFGEEHSETAIIRFTMGKTRDSLGQHAGQMEMRAATEVMERLLGKVSVVVVSGRMESSHLGLVTRAGGRLCHEAHHPPLVPSSRRTYARQADLHRAGGVGARGAPGRRCSARSSPTGSSEPAALGRKPGAGGARPQRGLSPPLAATAVERRPGARGSALGSPILDLMKPGAGSASWATDVAGRRPSRRPRL